MKLQALFLVGMTGLLPGTPAGAQEGQKWAVLVGIDGYQYIDPLRCAVNDTLRLAATLMEVCGFPRENVWVFTTDWQSSRALTDLKEFPLPRWFPDWLATHGQVPTRRNIEDRLTRLRGDMKSGDLFLFYFSGHGAEWPIAQGKRYYLALIDADPRQPDQLPQTCLEAAELQDWIGGMRTRNVLLILDACRDQPGRGFGESKDMPSGMARAFSLQPRPGQEYSATLFACRSGERSYEWEAKGHGYFTYFLLQGLRGQAAEPRNGRVTQKTLEDYLGKEVPKAVQGQGKHQEPRIIAAEHTPGYELLLTQLVKVRINALPWATVYVDEVEKGQTPLTLFLSAGTHVVRLDPPDARWRSVEKTIEVGLGQPNTLAETLPQQGGS